MKSKIRVLIVDDSTLYRSQIRAALADEDDIEVVGYAINGADAREALKIRQVDVVTLDMEMPVLDGIGLLTELAQLKIRPYVIVFSALTKTGADLTLSALRLGASDFLLKPILEPDSAQTPAAAIRALLVPKIRTYQTRGAIETAPISRSFKVSSLEKRFPTLNWNSFNPEAVVIASSTGGPAALESLFAQIRGPITRPILIVQHMPPIFTATLAERLAKISGLPVHEATNGMRIEKGHVYVAPGDYHMKIEEVGGQKVVAIDQGPQRNSVRPCANFLFESAAAVYRNAVLGIVMTGMGEDGKDGALALKNVGAGVMIQDRASCVVFGMPGAVQEAQAFDKMATIEGMAKTLADLCICSQQKAG